MDSLLILLVAFIIIIIVSFLAYKAGCNKKIEIVDYDKERIQKEIQSASDKIVGLEKEYQSKRQLIIDAKTNAENEYSLKKQTLDKEYKEIEFSLSEQHDYKKQALEDQLAIVRKELDSLRKTKAATVEAFQKEEALKEKADLYRLNISNSDKTDVDFLRSIQFKISKPRILSMLIWQTYFQPLAKKKFPMILGSQVICGIYKITNLLNNKIYIGQAVNVKERFNQHCKCGLGIDTPQSNKLYNDMLKDGLENFTFELLEECDKTKLNEKEAFYIGVYNSCMFGYNSVKGINV